MPFSDVVGHAAIVGLLKQATASRRVPQSTLFAGPDGVGKRTTALALAQAINCPRPSGGDACGQCPVCRRIARGQFPDVVVLDKGDEASIKIQALRERVLEAVGYRPFEGAKRVFIIDQADDLTLQAQDALLKTLEEPPSSAILILVSAAPDSLLPTIRSRCRRVRFGALSEHDVARVLIDRLGCDVESARRRSAASQGSVARAQVVEEKEFESDRQAAMSVLVAAGRGAVGARLQAAAAFVHHDKKRRAREAALTRTAILISLLRDLANVHAGRPVPLANGDLEADLVGLTRVFSPERISAAASAATDAAQQLDRMASPKIVADLLAVSL